MHPYIICTWSSCVPKQSEKKTKQNKTRLNQITKTNLTHAMIDDPFWNSKYRPLGSKQTAIGWKHLVIKKFNHYSSIWKMIIKKNLDCQVKQQKVDPWIEGNRTSNGQPSLNHNRNIVSIWMCKEETKKKKHSTKPHTIEILFQIGYDTATCVLLHTSWRNQCAQENKRQYTNMDIFDEGFDLECRERSKEWGTRAKRRGKCC